MVTLLSYQLSNTADILLARLAIYGEITDHLSDQLNILRAHSTKKKTNCIPPNSAFTTYHEEPHIEVEERWHDIG